MNNTTIMAIIDGNYGKIREYDNNEENQAKSKSVAQVLKAQNPDAVESSKVPLPSSYQPSNVDQYVSAIGKRLSDEELVEKAKRLEAATHGGYVYYMDTETIAAPDSVMEKDIRGTIEDGTRTKESEAIWKATKANKDGNYHNVITELYMHRQKYDVNGKPVGEPEKVFEFANTLSPGSLTKLDSYITQTEGANDLAYVRGRLAGYHEKGSVVNGVAHSWDGEANMLDTSVVAEGIQNLGENGIRVGSAEFKTQMQNVHDVIAQIGKDPSAALVTINGNISDIPWLKEAFTQAGVKIDNANIDAGHIDMQRMIEQTAKDKVFEGHIALYNNYMKEIAKEDKAGNKERVRELEEKVRNLDDNITNSGIVNAARGLGYDVADDGTLHLAKDDTAITQSGVEPFYKTVIDKSKEIEANMKTTVGKSSSNRIYRATRAVRAEKDDIFFSLDYNGTINNYNPTLMEAGHSYKMSMLDPSKIDGLKDREEIKDKQLLRITDMASDSQNESYLFVNKNTKKEEIQKRFLDSGGVEMIAETKVAQDEIDKTTKAANLDKARLEKASMFSVNSDKGYESFDRYYNMYEEYKAGVGDSASREHFEQSIRTGQVTNWGPNNETVSVEKAMPSLFSQRPDSKGSMIQERATNAIHMYEDFDKNHDYYKVIKESVDEKVPDYATFKKNHDLGNEHKTYQAYNKMRTQVLNETKLAVDDEMIEKLDDRELMEAYYNNPYGKSKQSVDSFLELERDKQLDINIMEFEKKYPGREYSQADLQLQVTDDQMYEIKKDNFKKLFGFDFDRRIDFVRDSALGVKADAFDLKNINEMDILGVDEGYTRIRVDSQENTIKDLNNRINAIRPANGRKGVNRHVKSEHLDNIAEDLYDRGLIEDHQFNKILTLDNPNPKVTMLAKYLNEDRKYFEKTARTITGTNDYAAVISKKGAKDVRSMAWDHVTHTAEHKGREITPEQAEHLNNYIDKIHVADPQVHPDGIETVAGVNKSDFMKARLGDVEGVKETISHIVSYSAEKAVPKLIVSKYDENSTASISKLLREEYGWTQNNADIFINGVIKNNTVQNLKYADGKKVNLSHMIVNEDGKGYFVTSTKEMQPKIQQLLSEGKGVEDLKEHSIVYKLPKVTTEYGGVRVMRQSDTAAKAITKEIVMETKKINGNDVSIFKQIDTLDSVNTSLKWGYEKAVQSLVNRNYEKANSLMSNKKINENKSTSGTVTRAVEMENGDIHILKTQKMSVADAMLGHKNKIGDLGVYSLDTVLNENEELRDKLIEKTSSNYVYGLERRIQDFKANPRGTAKMTFGQQGVGVKVWFAQNSSEIADTLLNSESFMDKHKDNKEVIGTLNALKEYGAQLFYGKESGEASEGILNMIPTHLKVAGAHYSGGSRPLINQVLSALAISENDALIYARRHLADKLEDGKNKYKTIQDVYSEIGFKPSRSFITESTLQDEKIAAAEGEHLAISTRVAFSSPKEFITRINSIDDALESDVAIKRIRKILDTNGVKNVSLEEIKRQAYALGSVTNLHEDSSAMDPKFARVLSAKTVISEDFNGDHRRFRVGEKLKNGTVLSIDKNGKQTKYTGKDVTIVGVNKETGKITAQQNIHYFDQKWGVGGSEKTEGHTPQLVNLRDVEIQHAVFQEVAGNTSLSTKTGYADSAVNLMFNPDIGKHEAWNTIFTPFSNAITNNVKDQAHADFINASFKKHFGDNISYEVRKEELGSDSRWELVEGKRKAGAEFDAFTAFENVINDIRAEAKKPAGGYARNVIADIDKFESTGVGWADIATMSDNTIENAAVWADGYVKGGAKINHRSQSVIGAFIGNDPLENILKYRKEVDGKLVTPLDALIQEDMRQMFNDKGFIKDMEQVSNIRTSLQLSMGEKVEGARIVDLKLSDVLIPGKRMSAMELPKAYGMERQINGSMQQVNGYRIKLEGMKIQNPLYEDLKRENKDGGYVYEHLSSGKFDPEAFAAKHGIKEEVDEIFLPALDPNRLDEKYTLTQVQKMASDLFETLDNIKSSVKTGSFGDLTHDELVKQLHTRYSQYMQAMRYELTDKNGLYKSSLNVQAENSARLKVAKIAAPLLDKNGQLLDREYKDIATKMIDGKVHYRGAVKVNPMTLFQNEKQMNQSFENFGSQVVRGKEVDNSAELFEFLKKDLQVRGKNVDSAKSVDDLRKIYGTMNLGQKDFHEIGKNYLRDVGFDARIMRDPAMLPTSYQTVRTFVNDFVTEGTVSVDPVIAKWINGDGDGDEFNFYNYMFEKSKNGGFKLRHEDHEIAQAMKYDVGIHEDEHMKVLKSIAKDVDADAEAKRASYRTLAGYHDNIKRFREDLFMTEDKIFNVDYMGNKSTELLNLLSRFLKDSVGQVSNPNYYLRTASTYYASGRGLNVENLRMQRNIQLLTKTTEQNLIDIKSVKHDEDANRLLRIATTYKHDIDELGNLKKTEDAQSNIHASIMSLLEGTGQMIYEKNKDIVAELPDNFLTDATVRDEMATRIMEGTYKRGENDQVTLEEIYGDTFKILQNEEANKVFNSPTVRQTDVYSKNGDPIPEFERNRRATGSSEDFNTGGAKLFDATSNREFTTRSPIIGDRFLARGDVIHSTDINGSVSPGTFMVDSVGREHGQAVMNIKDLSSGEIVNLSGKNFDEISDQVKDFGIMSRYSNLEDVENKIDEVGINITKQYEDKFTGDIEGHDMLSSLKGNDIPEYLNNPYAKKVGRRIDEATNLDILGTVEALKQQQIVNPTEAASLIKNMNDGIRQRGLENYADVKREAILGSDSIKGLALTNAGYKDWAEKHISPTIVNRAVTTARYRNDLEKLRGVTRYDIDNLSEHMKNVINTASEHKNFEGFDTGIIDSSKSKVFSEMMEGFKLQDDDAMDRFRKFYSKHSASLDFQKEVLGLEFDKGIQLMNAKDYESAMAHFGKTKVSFGKYVGMSLEQLGKEQMNEILTDDYLKQGIDVEQNVVEQTKKIINKMTEMDESDIMNVSINPKLPNEDIIGQRENDFITEARQKLNEDIKSKGARRTEKQELGRIGSLFNKAKTAFNEMSGTKKKLLAGTALALAGIGAINMYQSGSRTLEGKDGDYTKPREPDVDNIKSTSNYSDKGSYSNVPQSNHRFYASQNNGLNVNVEGENPVGSRSDHAANLIKNMMGGSDVKVSTSVSDSRQDISDQDVDEAMSKATY